MKPEHPRLIRGSLIVCSKDGQPPKGGILFANTYLGRHIKEVPDYWDNLHKMIYGRGRLKKYAAIVEDIVDKFSFLFLARDQFGVSEQLRDPVKRFLAQYHTYTYVFMTKSFLDACAVFINESYGLGERGNNISLENKSFLDRLEQSNQALANQLRDRKGWIDLVALYRRNLIHRHGLYVGPIPTVPESITNPEEVDQFILAQPAYMPNNPNFVIDKIYEGEEGEFIKVSDIINEWIDTSSEIFHIVLRSFTLSFELYDPNEI